MPILMVRPLQRPKRGTRKTSVLFLSKLLGALPFTSTRDRLKFGALDLTEYSNGDHTFVAVSKLFKGDAALLNSCIFAIIEFVFVVYNNILIKLF
jgi:hypothetical protein